MLDKICTYIKTAGIVPPPAKVVAGVSGGADSVVLADVLQKLGYELCAVHCNFHIRGAEADRDEAFVRNFCESRKIKLHVEHFDTPAYAKEQGISIEMAARDLRYALFDRQLQQENAAGIFVAHHADDSIETVFLNLIRGTGLKGLCGIAPVSGKVMRPLLCVSRKEIEEYALQNSLSYITDSTNLQNDYLRNKIRNQILPLIYETRPDFRQVMAANMENFCQAELVYSACIKREIRNAVTQCGDKQTLDLQALESSICPEALLHEWLKAYGFTPLQSKAAVNLTQTRAQLCSATHRLTKERDALALSPIKPLCGELRLEDVLTIEESTDCSIVKDKNTAVFDADKLQGPLSLRYWQDGDKFQPIGMGGKTKKVSDVLTDMKIDASARKEAMVLLCGNQIAWLVGIRPDERFKVTAQTRRTLRVTLV